MFFPFSDLRLLRSDGSDLSHEEILKLWEFFNMLTGSINSRFIFRGESDENLMKQFNVDSRTPDLLAEYLFMTGEKGRICWEENGGFDPEDISNVNFLNICQSLIKYIDDGVDSGGNRAKRIIRFCEKNEEFYKGIKNEVALAEAYEKLEPEDKKKVNLYYLAIAHTINDREYRDVSTFISTSTNADVADRFAHDVIIYGWVPQMIGKGSVRRRIIEQVDINDKVTIKHTGLPYCKVAVFPNQEEIAIRCGLLPHFIIGFAIKMDFYVNPAVFTAIDDMSQLNSFREFFAYRRKLQLYGMKINQENFEDFCRRTNFKRYYTFNGEGKYEIHKVT